MSLPNKNLSTIRTLNEAFNRRDDRAARELFGRDFVGDHIGLAAFGPARQLGGLEVRDTRLESRETVAASECVIDRLIFSGRDTAGKTFTVQHIHWWTLKDGLIVGHRAQRDDISMLMQLERLPVVPLVAQKPNPAEERIAHRNVVGTHEQERNLAVMLENRRAHVRKDMDGVIATFAGDAQNHGRARGRDGMRMVIGDIFETYTPVTDDDGIEDVVAVDDCVVVAYLRQVRHTGVGRLPINGGMLIGVPPTNKVYTERHIHWWTLKDGLIVQHRACRDDVGMMIDLGLWPLAES